MNRNLDKTSKNYKPLRCMRCGKDLLETGYGNVVYISDRDQCVPPTRYLGCYWACKSCDEKVEAAYFSSGPFCTSCKGIDELKNPLEFARWAGATSRLISDGRISATAAAKIREVKDILAQVALREPTKADYEQFWLLRQLDGI